MLNRNESINVKYLIAKTRNIMLWYALNYSFIFNCKGYVNLKHQNNFTIKQVCIRVSFVSY